MEHTVEYVMKSDIQNIVELSKHIRPGILEYLAATLKLDLENSEDIREIFQTSLIMYNLLQTTKEKFNDVKASSSELALNKIMDKENSVTYVRFISLTTIVAQELLILIDQSSSGLSKSEQVIMPQLDAPSFISKYEQNDYINFSTEGFHINATLMDKDHKYYFYYDGRKYEVKKDTEQNLKMKLVE